MLKKVAIEGFIILSIRRLLIQIIQTSANIVLARILFPQDFGTFAIVLLVVNVGVLFSDIGLQGALIQYAKTPTDSKTQTIFTFHVIIGAVASVAAWFILPVVLSFYQIRWLPGKLWLYQIGALAILFYNLRLVPTGLLERELAYRILAVGEILELSAQSVISLVLAISGLGIISLVAGLVGGRTVAALFFNYYTKWPVRFSFKFREIRPLIKYGYSYQINQIIHFISGASAPIVVGFFLGTIALGYINWAAGVAALGFVVSELVGRLIFTLCSRFQKSTKHLADTISYAVELTTILSLPLYMLLYVFAEPITRIIFTEKWLAAVPALQLFVISSLIQSYGNIINNALMGIGDMKAVKQINFMRTIVLWLSSLVLVKYWGINGYAWAMIVSSSIYGYGLYKLSQHVNLAFISIVLRYLLYSLMAVTITRGFGTFIIIKNVTTLAAIFFLYLILYAGLIVIFRYREVNEKVRYTFSLLSQK